MLGSPACRQAGKTRLPKALDVLLHKTFVEFILLGMNKKKKVAQRKHKKTSGKKVNLRYR